MYNFAKQEEEIKLFYSFNLNEEMHLLDEMFSYKEEAILKINGKVKNNQVKERIQIYLAENLTSLYCTYELLIRGYLKISQALLRQPLEALALSIYFNEFPEDESLFSKSEKKFYKHLAKLKDADGKNYKGIGGALKRVDDKDSMTNISWYKRLYLNHLNQANKFLHSDIDHIYLSSYIGTSDTIEQFTLGPNKPDINNAKTAFFKIMEILTYDILVQELIFSDILLKRNQQLFDKSSLLISNWKDEYYKINSTQDMI